jgi:DNA polymerase-3 subunit epsilon
MIAQDRALVFFDLEATGVNPLDDRIIEVCFLRREPDGRESVFASLVNPGRPIPPDATEVNHITNAMVQGCPTFKDFAPQILALLADADLAGFNILHFDIPLLAAEIARAGMLPSSPPRRRILDAYLIFHRREPHSLSGAARLYCGLDLATEAHRAEADVRATAAVLDAQVERYADLGRDVAGVAEWLRKKDPRFVDRDGKFRWSNGEAVFAFGKHTGRTLRAVAVGDRDHLEWMARSSFSVEVVALVRKALAGEYPVRDGVSGLHLVAPEREAKP